VIFSLIPAPFIFKYERHVLTLRAQVLGVHQFEEFARIGDSQRNEVVVSPGFRPGTFDRGVVIKGYRITAPRASRGIPIHVIPYEEFIAVQANRRSVTRVHEIRKTTANEDFGCIETALAEAP
jgi:hypothetical protein